jgi:ketosteroid isomerase-like protein
MAIAHSSIDLNRSVVTAFWDLVSGGRFDDARALVDPEGEWWTLGRRAARPCWVVVDVLQDLHQRSSDGLVFTVGTVTAESDRVAIELAGHAQLPDRGAYDNLYYFLFRLRRGVIREVWEYYDTALSNSVFRPSGVARS